MFVHGRVRIHKINLKVINDNETYFKIYANLCIVILKFILLQQKYVRIFIFFEKIKIESNKIGF